MSNDDGRRRTSSRLSRNSTNPISYNEKSLSQGSKRSDQSRSQNVSASSNSNKRRKVELSKEEKLVDIMTDFDLAVNELYQLKEYKSIVSWQPQDFSIDSEPFQNFKDENNYKIKWDEEIEDDNELKSLPFRFQKKKIAEREDKLIKKYPFKNQVIENVLNRESELFLSSNSDPIKVENRNLKPNSNKIKTEATKSTDKGKQRQKAKKLEAKSKSRQIKEENEETNGHISNDEAIDEEHDEEEDQTSQTVQFNDRVKRVSWSIPSLIVTHPSHVPGWQPPTEGASNAIIESNETDEVLEFQPESLKITETKDDTIYAPNLDTKLQHFLDYNCKFPIIDEALMPEYNFTKQEYDSMNSQQQTLFKSILQKMNENVLEYNSNKIERRKILLPPTSNVRLNDPFRDTSAVTPKLQGSANNFTHHDYLVAQGMSFSRIHHQMRRQHINKTRKIASIIDQHFKKKRGEAERLRREREQNLKKISRNTMQAIKKRWNEAFKVYQMIQNEKLEEMKKVKGREHLSQMLEHSTQLLEAQLTSSKEATAESELISDIENDDDDDEDEDKSDNEDSDDFFSSSEDEEENNGQAVRANGHALKEEEDINLSVEELRKKYADIDSSREATVETSEKESVRESEDEVSDDEDEEDESFDDNKGLAALYGDEVVISNGADSELEQKDSVAIRTEELDSERNSLLDSDESSSMTSSSSDEDIEEEEEKEGQESEGDVETKLNGTHETTTHNGGLSSLFEKDVDDSGSDEDVEIENLSDEDDDSLNNTEDESMNEIASKEANGTLDNVDVEMKSDTEDESNVEIINGAKVKDVPIPSLLRGTLRPYQKQGLNWMASLYNNNTNGILADEMGLGKTIQTISLLSYLACEHHVWGPHLIIVPTSVMLNWDMEFKKFAPGFKVLTYYGSPQQRAQKRKGWNKPDAFHVCITSYQLVVQDQQAFKRRKWKYMILDEAHNIKNFRSTRWKALLNFNTENRLLLTGTPLQNNLMELWSLLYFLMPSSKVNLTMPEGFANLEDFQQWFGKPVDKILEQTSLGNNSDLIDENEKTTAKMDDETKNTVSRLHQVLRPYILRRLKKDVEKQMPGKYEHIVYCRLSKRQRYLYDDFMSRAKTKETLASGNFLSIINCLMQLRKVCNHPDLFEVRPIVTSFAIPKSASSDYQLTNEFTQKLFANEEKVNFDVLNLKVTDNENLNFFVTDSISKLQSTDQLQNQIDQLKQLKLRKNEYISEYVGYFQNLKIEEQLEIKDKLEQVLYLNKLRSDKKPIYGNSLMKFLTMKPKNSTNELFDKFCLTLNDRVDSMKDEIEQYSILTPTVVALDMKDQLIPKSTQYRINSDVASNKITNPFHHSQVKLSIAFPDKTLLQYDCGKLQKLATLLRDLTAEGHRALIFTQMTKVLDILEQFLNIHGYRYMRLDGATKIEDRQLLTEKFNRDPKIPVFILSTRSGGLGINLTGADTVIFYDSDWNPAMDKQCQDRCHRIGQVRDVHIYRFVSEYTIESNIIKKANQKRQLDNVVIQEGDFTTDYFGKFSVRDLVQDPNISQDVPTDRTIDFSGDGEMGKVFAQAEDEEDRAAAGAALKEVAIDDEDFSEGITKPVEINEDDENADLDFDEGVGHIDEYMLRFIAEGYY